MKISKAYLLGLFQALGLTIYVSLFAFVVNTVSQSGWEPELSPMIGMILFLLAFVFSALVTGAIILGYPITLFFTGKKRLAMTIIVWSAVWLLLIGMAVFLIMVLTH